MGLGRRLLIGGIAVGAGIGVARLLDWEPDSLDDLYNRSTRPLIVGHRGASAVAPENTLPAFAEAIDQGADGIELDVHRTADGHLVVIHNFSLDKTTSGRGWVRQRTLAQLRLLDAGAWFGSAFAGTKIPTLREALELCRDRVVVNVEIKTISARGEGLEGPVTELVAELNMQRQVIISSFNPAALWRVKQTNDRIPTGLLYGVDAPVHISHGWIAPLVRPDALHPHRSLVTTENVQSAHARGHRVNVWTVNDEAEIARLVRLGVDGIITDDPATARRVRDTVLRETGGAA